MILTSVPILRTISFLAWKDERWVRTLRGIMFLFASKCVAKCYEPVIGFKEGNKHKQWFEPTDIENLVIFKRGYTFSLIREKSVTRILPL